MLKRNSVLRQQAGLNMRVRCYIDDVHKNSGILPLTVKEMLGTSGRSHPASICSKVSIMNTVNPLSLALRTANGMPNNANLYTPAEPLPAVRQHREGQLHIMSDGAPGLCRHAQPAEVRGGCAQRIVKGSRKRAEAAL
jgi:hypothetical protein